jgi:hypothetical protein
MIQPPLPGDTTFAPDTIDLCWLNNPLNHLFPQSLTPKETPDELIRGGAYDDRMRCSEVLYGIGVAGDRLADTGCTALYRACTPQRRNAYVYLL